MPLRRVDCLGLGAQWGCVMTDLKLPALPGHAEKVYDRMLARVEAALVKAELATWETLRSEIEAAVEFEQDVAELTRRELDLLAAYLRRDLEHLTEFVRESGGGVREWLKLDVALIEKKVLDLLLSIADNTQVELLELQQKMAHPRGKYMTGELALAGMLRCLQCGHMVCLTESARLASCHVCSSRYFERVTGRWPHGAEVADPEPESDV